MPNLPISQLPSITAITADAEFVVVQDDITYKISSGNIASGNILGSFYSSINQTITGTTTESYVMSAETSVYSKGITVVDGSKITVASGGTYNLEFSAQLKRSSGSSVAIVSIWFRKNGVDIPDSCTDVIVGVTIATSAIVPSWNFVETMLPNDYIEVVWSSNDSGIYLSYEGERTNPTRPAVPSLILTMTHA